jgi:hypothetical protein
LTNRPLAVSHAQALTKCAQRHDDTYACGGINTARLIRRSILTGHV